MIHTLPQLLVIKFQGDLQSPAIPRANCSHQVSPLLQVQLHQVLQHLGAVVRWTLSVDQLSIDEEQTDPGSCHQFDIFVSGDGHDWSLLTVSSKSIGTLVRHNCWTDELSQLHQQILKLHTIIMTKLTTSVLFYSLIIYIIPYSFLLLHYSSLILLTKQRVRDGKLPVEKPREV